MDQSTDPPAILASDAEREHSLVSLRDAVVEGRLTLEEFSERVDRVHQARTGRELSILTVDLPSLMPAPPSSAANRYRAICSSLVRRGGWELPARSEWRSVFGTINLDLRQVRLAGADTELDIYNLFGTVTVLIPAGVAVEVHGGGLFASQNIQPPAWPAPPGAPRLRIHVSGPGGTLHVRSDEPRRLSKPIGDGGA